MGWGAQQWLRITKEATYGTFDAAATVIWWVRIPDDDAFTMRAVPQRQTIRSADSGNRRVQQVSPRKAVAGNLTTIAYPTQMGKWLDMALTLTANDLFSYSIDYWDGVQEHRFLGVKCASLGYTSGADHDYVDLSLSLIGQSKGTTTLTQPAFTVFPSEVPYVHFESKGLISIAAAAVTKYKTASFTINNTLDGTWDEDQWITSLIYGGRDVNTSITPQYATSTLRTAFETQSALALSMGWTRPSGLATTIDLKATNYMANCLDNLKLGGANYQAIDLEAYFDATALTDCSFTVV
jgi:hypothetical protein